MKNSGKTTSALIFLLFLFALAAEGAAQGICQYTFLCPPPPTASFSAATNLAATGPESVAVGDLNRDGIPDHLAIANGNGNTVSVRLGNGDGTFGNATQFGVGATPYYVVIGDFNRNGKEKAKPYKFCSGPNRNRKRDFARTT